VKHQVYLSSNVQNVGLFWIDESFIVYPCNVQARTENPFVHIRSTKTFELIHAIVMEEPLHLFLPCFSNGFFITQLCDVYSSKWPNVNSTFK